MGKSFGSSHELKKKAQRRVDMQPYFLAKVSNFNTRFVLVSTI